MCQSIFRLLVFVGVKPNVVGIPRPTLPSNEVIFIFPPHLYCLLSTPGSILPSCLENLGQLSNNCISCFSGACATAHILGSQPGVDGSADRILDYFSLMREIQRVTEHHGDGKNSANGILQMVSALYVPRKNSNCPRRVNVRQSLSLIYPARYLSYTLATNI